MEHDRLQLIESRAETLLQELKEDNHAFIYSTAFFILVVLYLLAIVFLYIKIGFSISLLVYIVLLIGFLAFYKINMKQAYGESNALLGFKSMDRDDKVNYVAGMLRYLVSGFDVKVTRIRSVKWFYTVIFPVFLLILRELFIAPLHSDDWLINLPLVLIMGGFWYYYFTREEKELIRHRYETENIIQKVYS